VTRPTQVPFERQDSCHLRDCHPLWSDFPDSSVSRLLCNSHVKGPTTPQRKTSAVWAVSPSLAATEEIAFAFYSCGYLDVSVHRICHAYLCIQHALIQVPRDQSLFDNSPGLFAVFHALHRLLMPRHPPCALSSLTTMIQLSLTLNQTQRPIEHAKRQITAATTTSQYPCPQGKSPTNRCS
jgi:hypothetical protein